MLSLFSTLKHTTRGWPHLENTRIEPNESARSGGKAAGWPTVPPVIVTSIPASAASTVTNRCPSHTAIAMVTKLEV